MEQQKMVKVSVQVRSGTARFFGVGVKARSTRKALSMVGGRYPHGEVRVVLPTEPEESLVREPSALAGIVGSAQAHAEAA
jgi:hypothetical protein